MLESSCTSYTIFPRTALPGYSAVPHTVDLYRPGPQTYLSLHPCDQPCKMAKKKGLFAEKRGFAAQEHQLTEGLVNLRHNRSLAFGCASYPTPQPLFPVRGSDLLSAGGVEH